MTDLKNYVWYCDECDDCLSDQDGFDPYCGTWTCDKCGYVNTIDESEIIDDDYESDDDEDVPEGCAACGGPYPMCKDSCPIFDD